MLRGKSYAEYFETHSQVFDQGMPKVLPPTLSALTWKAGENILDYGCATGRTVAKYFAPLAEKYDLTVYATDQSRSMIEWAKAHNAHPKVEYAQTSLCAEDFPYKDVKFDKIFCLLSLTWEPNYGDTLKKIYELLVPGGLAIVVFIGKTSFFDCRAHLKGHEEFQHIAEHVHIPIWHSDPSEVEQPRILAEEIGFQIVEAEIIPGSYIFSSRSDCAEFFLAKDAQLFESTLGEEDTLHHKVHEEFEQCLATVAKREGKDEKDGFELEYNIRKLVMKKPEA